MDGLVPMLDCCKSITVSTDRSISVVPYTPLSKSAPPDSVSATSDLLNAFTISEYFNVVQNTEPNVSCI